MSIAQQPATLADLDTPALCLDLDRFERNIAAVVALCRKQGVDWRPHAKCHKSQDIARQLVAAGAIGLTCAKLGEAEVFADAGVTDLLIANMIVGPRKLARLAELRKIADPIVCVDSTDQAEPMSQVMSAEQLTVRVMIEVDIGLNRVGAEAGAAPALADRIAALPGLELAGVMGYEGHLLTVEDLDEKRRLIAEALRELVQVAEQLRSGGHECPIVSCGGTGSLSISACHPGITEVQAGGAIFMDEFYRNSCQVDFLEQALTVHATVVSRPTPDRAVIDAGRKAIHGDKDPPAVIEPAIDAQVQQLSAEHGSLLLGEGVELKVGDRVVLAPGYGDMTTVLHNDFYGHRGERIEAVWPLHARGRLQ